MQTLFNAILSEIYQDPIKAYIHIMHFHIKDLVERWTDNSFFIKK